MRSFKTLDTEAREAIKERIFLGIKDKLKKTTTYSYQTKLSILWILGLTDDLSTHTQRSLSQSFRKNVFQNDCEYLLVFLKILTEICTYIIYSSMTCYRLIQITYWTESIGRFGYSENTYPLDLPMSSIFKSGIVSGTMCSSHWDYDQNECFEWSIITHAYLRWTKSITGK